MVQLVSEVDVVLVNASASDDMVAMAAWVSHDADSEARLKEKDRVAKLINFLYSNRHMSPFEHGLFTFKVDVPLFVAREFQRHRTASYNEVSGRYTEMKPRFYVGDTARVQKGKPGAYFFEDGSEENTALYRRSKKKATKKAWKEYRERLEAGIAKEQAREDLPLSMMTQFYVTMNPRNLMQFLTLRNDKHALKEIRDVAVQMENIFADVMPLTYATYKKNRDENVADYKAQLLSNATLIAKQADQIAVLTRTLHRTEQERNVQAIEIRSLQDAKADIESRYNALYTKHEELIAAANEMTPEPKVDPLKQATDYVVNIFGNNDIDKIAQAVLKAAKQAERTRPNRRQ